MRTITIKDIARHAGVAASTVSAVLNGKARQMRISEDSELRIRGIADQMGYHPNHTAVSLRTGKSGVLGLIVEDISNIFFASLAKAIEEEADATGFKVLYCSTENNMLKGRERIKMLMRHQVEGFLLTPAEGLQKELAELVEKKKPVVLMDRYFPDMDLPHVLVDNYDGVQQGVEHMIQMGYRKIAFVTVALNQVQMQFRKKAWQQTLMDHGQEPGERLLELVYHSKPELATSQIKSFLQDHPDTDAVFFATNYLGVYGLEAIKELGWSIPGRIAVVCFDDNDIFRLFTPGITIIRQPVEEIGRVAMQLLLQQLIPTLVPTRNRHAKLAAALVKRGSV